MKMKMKMKMGMKMKMKKRREREKTNGGCVNGIRTTERIVPEEFCLVFDAQDVLIDTSRIQEP